MKEQAKEQKLIKLNHAAKMYDMNEKTLRHWALTGVVKAVKIRDRWFIDPKVMADFVARGGR